MNIVSTEPKFSLELKELQVDLSSEQIQCVEGGNALTGALKEFAGTYYNQIQDYAPILPDLEGAGDLVDGFFDSLSIYDEPLFLM